MRASSITALIAVGVLGVLLAQTDKDDAFIGSRGKYWAFQKPLRPDVPKLADPWIRTPIDAFVLEGLQAKGLTPSPQLDRIRLFRRVTFDLTGLPPTPAAVEAFLHDRSPKAYETVVERLLASPHYGERWALKWLDVVRYADTNGYELDADRPNAWRYRDYVVNAFQRDKPYDRFIREQIAGDEMFPGDQESLIATGYLRAGSEHLVAGKSTGGEPAGGAHRDCDQSGRADLPRPDRQLRPMPQPQVRSDPSGRLLPPAGDLRRRRRARTSRSSRRTRRRRADSATRPTRRG